MESVNPNTLSENATTFPEASTECKIQSLGNDSPLRGQIPCFAAAIPFEELRNWKEQRRIAAIITSHWYTRCQINNSISRAPLFGRQRKEGRAESSRAESKRGGKHRSQRQESQPGPGGQSAHRRNEEACHSDQPRIFSTRYLSSMPSCSDYKYKHQKAERRLLKKQS